MGRCPTSVVVLALGAVLTGACQGGADDPTAVAPADVTTRPDPPGQAPDDPPPPVSPHHARCKATDPFDAPVPIAGLEAVDGTARLTTDELGVVFSDRRADGSVELFQASRASTTSAFGARSEVAGLGMEGSKLFPALTGDGLGLWFAFMTVTDEGPRVEIFSAARSSLAAPFGGAHPATELNVFRENTTPYVAHHAPEIWFVAGPSADVYEIFTSRLSAGKPATPTQVIELNTPYSEVAPVLSDDGLSIYWSSSRPDGNAKGSHDVWVATRKDPSTRFDTPRNVAEINTETMEYPAWVSPDLCHLYLVRGETSPTTLLLAKRSPR